MEKAYKKGEMYSGEKKKKQRSGYGGKGFAGGERLQVSDFP